MSMYCRITGKSRGLPKPNYFPLLPPISPADAKKLCRITGNTKGLPTTHHFIPIPLIPKSRSPGQTTCPVTGKSVGQPQHHFIPEVPANTAELRHQPISGYRYVVPVLDNPPPPLQDLLSVDIQPDSIEAQYVYTLEEQKCGIVLPANIEAAVRQGKVSGMSISDNNEKVSLKLLEGKQVTVKVLSMKQQPTTEVKEDAVPLLDGQGPSKKAQEKQKKLAEAKAKKKENDIELKKIFEDKETKAEKAELASVIEKKPRPVKPPVSEQVSAPLVNGIDNKQEIKPEITETLKTNATETVKPVLSADVTQINKVSALNTKSNVLQPYIVPYDELSKVEINPEEKIAPLPEPINIPQCAKISVASCEPGIVNKPSEAILRATVGLPPTTVLIPAMPSRNQLDTSVLKSIWDIAKRDQQTLDKTANAANVLTAEHLDKLASLQDILKLTKNLEKGTEAEIKWGKDVLHGKNVQINKDKSCFVPGLAVNGKFIPGQTIDNEFVAGLTIKMANKVGLIPGCVMKDEEFVAGINKEGKFIPGQIFNTGEKAEFVPGQTVVTPEGPRFIAGQTVCGKFVPGLIVETENGPEFIHGHSPAAGDFIPGQVCYRKDTGEPIFVTGQTILENGETKFVPGQTISTKQGPQFIPGREINDANKTFIPGLSENNEFIPGAVLSTPTGDKFIEGRVLVNPEGRSRFIAGKSEKDGFMPAKTDTEIKARPYKEKKVPYKQKRNVVYGHMLQMESGVQFFPDGNSLPTIGVTRSIPGQLVKNNEDDEEPRFIPGMTIDGIFVAGQMVRTMEGTKFVPGQLVRTKDGAKFVPGQTLDDGQFVPGQVVEDKFVPGQIVQTAAGPTFIPGQVISTPEEGARFVPGRVVDTSEGPRFAPGRVIEDGNGGVAFIPGRVVETEQGPHFIAPDLESTPDGNIQFSMQSFEVSPEELQLIDQANINLEDSGNIDSKMLAQLANAGITLAQKNLPDVYVCPVKNLQEIATHITERLKLPAESQDKMALVLKKVAELGHNITTAKITGQGIKPEKAVMHSEIQIQAYELIESAIKAAMTTASKDISLNPDEAIINEMSSVLEDAVPSQFKLGNEPYPEVLLSALFEVVSSEANLEAISCSVQQGLKRSIANKVEVLKDIAQHAENVQETVAKISKVLRRPKSHLDIGKAFKRLSVGDPELVDLVVSKVGEKVEGVSTEKEAAQTLQNSIVSAVRECSEKEIFDILDSSDQSGLKHLILQAVALARALGLNAAAEELLMLLKDSRIASALATDQTALEILQRLTLMKKLSESRPGYAQAMVNLNSVPYKEDTRYLKQLVRESEALLTSVREEDDSYASDDDDYSYSNSSFNSTFDDEIISRVPKTISSSNDIPLALFHALVDCQKPMQLLRRLLKASQPEYQYTYDHACVILKNKIQAVIPKESAKSVLTGKASYTLIDDKGVSRFNAMDVFSALKIDKPFALKKFSLYTAGLESTWAYAREIEEDLSCYGNTYAGNTMTQGTLSPVSGSLSEENILDMDDCAEMLPQDNPPHDNLPQNQTANVDAADTSKTKNRKKSTGSKTKGKVASNSKTNNELSQVESETIISNDEKYVMKEPSAIKPNNSTIAEEKVIIADQSSSNTKETDILNVYAKSTLPETVSSLTSDMGVSTGENAIKSNDAPVIISLSDKIMSTINAVKTLERSLLSNNSDKFENIDKIPISSVEDNGKIPTSQIQNTKVQVQEKTNGDKKKIKNEIDTSTIKNMTKPLTSASSEMTKCTTSSEKSCKTEAKHEQNTATNITLNEISKSIDNTEKLSDKTQVKNDTNPANNTLANEENTSIASTEKKSKKKVKVDPKSAKSTLSSEKTTSTSNSEKQSKTEVKDGKKTASTSELTEKSKLLGSTVMESDKTQVKREEKTSPSITTSEISELTSSTEKLRAKTEVKVEENTEKTIIVTESDKSKTTDSIEKLSAKTEVKAEENTEKTIINTESYKSKTSDSIEKPNDKVEVKFEEKTVKSITAKSNSTDSTAKPSAKNEVKIEQETIRPIIVIESDKTKNIVSTEKPNEKVEVKIKEKLVTNTNTKTSTEKPSAKIKVKIGEKAATPITVIDSDKSTTSTQKPSVKVVAKTEISTTICDMSKSVASIGKQTEKIAVDIEQKTATNASLIDSANNVKSPSEAKVITSSPRETDTSKTNVSIEKPVVKVVPKTAVSLTASDTSKPNTTTKASEKAEVKFEKRDTTSTPLSTTSKPIAGTDNKKTPFEEVKVVPSSPGLVETSKINDSTEKLSEITEIKIEQKTATSSAVNDKTGANINTTMSSAEKTAATSSESSKSFIDISKTQLEVISNKKDASSNSLKNTPSASTTAPVSKKVSSVIKPKEQKASSPAGKTQELSTTNSLSDKVATSLNSKSAEKQETSTNLAAASNGIPAQVKEVTSTPLTNGTSQLQNKVEDIPKVVKQTAESNTSSVVTVNGNSSAAPNTSPQSTNKTPTSKTHEKLYIATRDYVSEDADGLSLMAGDIVEILDMNPEPANKRVRMDPDMEVSELLDTSAARHKMAIRPKRKHTSTRQQQGGEAESETETRWLAKQRKTGGAGFVPMSVLKRHGEPTEVEEDYDPRRMRDAVVRELIETEQELGRDLNFVLEKYIKAVDAGGAKVPMCVRDNKDLIFSNFRKIAEFHNTYLIEGVKYYAHEPKMLGKTFLRLERDFDQHVNYCRDEVLAQDFLAENEEAREYFAELSHQLGDDKTLSEHLKLPIQRINDYQLLLRELAKYTGELKENPSDLLRALDFMLAVPTKANDSKFINSIEGYKGNIHKLGRLLRHDWFTVTDAQGRSKERYLFLFKARILICKVKRISEDRSVFLLKDIIKLPECEVNDLPDDPLSYKVVHKRPEIHPRYPLILKAHTPTAKPNWLEDIQQYVTDSVALFEHNADDLQIDGPSDADVEDKSRENLRQKLLELEEQQAREAKEAKEAREREKAAKDALLNKKKKVPAKTGAASEEKPTEEAKPSEASTSQEPSADTAASSATEPAAAAAPTTGEPSATPATGTTPAVPATATTPAVPATPAAPAASATAAPAASEAAITPSAPAAAPATAAAPAAPAAAPATGLTSSAAPVIAAVAAAIKPTDMSQTITESVESQSLTQTVKESVTTTVTTEGGVSEKQSLRLNISTTEQTVVTMQEGVSSVPATPTSPPPTPIREPNRPRFTATIEPHSCEPGETTTFTCEIQATETPALMTWLKDNKPLEDALMDRVSISSEADNTKFKFNMLHCRESDSGTYTARASNFAGATTCSASLVVQELTPEEKARRAAEKGAMFLVKLKDTSVLEETYLRFMIKVKGDPNPVIKFFKDDKLITEADERITIVSEKAAQGFYELVVPNVHPGDAGRYTCSVMNKYGEDKCEANVKVVAEKDAFSALHDTIIRPGENTDFKWLRDGKPFDPEERFKVLFKDEEDTLSLVFQHVKPEDAGLYTCVASTTSGKISCSAELTVQGAVNQLQREPEKPQVITEAKSAESAIGASAMLELKVKGFPKPDVKWTHEGKDVTAGGRFRFLYEDDESMALVIKNVEASDGGKYKVVAKNELGESALEIELLVKAPPKFRTKLEDIKAMTEETLTVEIEVDGSPKPDIKWFKDGKQVTAGDRIKLTTEGNKQRLVIDKATIADSGSYSVTAANDISQATEYFKIAVNAPPKFIKELSKMVEARETDDVTLDVKIQCSPPPQVKWYICKPSVSSMVKEYKMEEGKEEIKVDGKHVVITQDGENYTLKLTGVSRSDTGFYRCAATNEHGTSFRECEVNVKCTPQVTAKLENMTIKEGDTQVTLSVGVNAYPEPKVKWFLNDIEITESRTEFSQSSHYGAANLTLKNVTPELAGKYTCKIQNELGAAESSASYTVLSKPRFPKPLKDTEVDEGQTLNLSASVFGVPAPTVKWYKDGGEVSADARIKITKEGSETYNLSVTIVKGQDAGEYEARATNDQGTTSTISKVHVSKKITTTVRREENEEVTVTQDIANNAQNSNDDTTNTKKKQAEIADAETCEIERKQEVKEKQVDKKTSKAKLMETAETPQEKNNDIKSKSAEETQGRKSSKAKLMEKPETPQEEKTNSKSKSAEETEGRKSSKAKLMDLGSEDKVDASPEGVVITEISTEIHSAETQNGTEPCKTEVRDPASLEEGGGKPRTSRSLSTGAERGKKEELSRKHSADTLCRVPETQEVRAQSPQRGTRDLGDDGDEEMDALMRRVQKQRSVLGEILEQEDSRNKDAVPSIISHTLNDAKIYESLGIIYEVHADGIPRPEAKWYKDGTEIKDKRFKVSDSGKEYKLEITEAVMDDAGVYKCVVKNRLGEKSQETTLKLISVNEYRKPTISKPTEALIIKKNELGVLTVVLQADPLPEITWSHDGTEISAEEGVYEMNMEFKDIQDNLKECTYTLTLPKGQHKQTGEYKFFSKNKYGEGECSSRLDVYLVPEIDGFKDQTTIPYETIQFEVVIFSNPKPKVTWKRGEEVISNCEHTQLIADIEAEVYRIVITNIGLGDDGLYTVTASNSQGESQQQAVLKVHTEVPSFVKAIEDQTIKAYHDVDFRVRVAGVPKPHIKWFKEGKELNTEGRFTVENDEEHQVSGLMIEKLAESDPGVYSVTASNLVGQAECSAQLAMAQIAPSFIKPVDKNIEVDEGDKLEIKTKLDGSPLPVVTWFKDGEELKADDHVKITVLPDGTVELVIEHVKPTDCGAYKILAANRNGERANLTAVAVKPNPRKPVFVKPLQDVKGKAGVTLKLEAQIMAFPAPEIHWTKDGHPVRASQHVSFINSPGGVIGIKFETATPEDAGKYALSISNRLGDLSAVAVLEVEAAERTPVFQSALQPTKVVADYPCKLQIKVYGHPKPKLTWTHRGTDIVVDGKHYSEVTAPDGTVSLLIDKARPEDAGEYSVTATNDLGSVTCKSKLEVVGRDRDDAPEEVPSFLHNLRDVNAEEGAPLVMEAPFAGNPIPEVTWTKDDQPIAAGGKYTLTCDGRRVGLEVRPAEMSDAGKYECTLTNRLGKASSAAAVGVRKVYQPPTFKQTFSDLQQLPGYDAKFVVRVNGLPAPDIIWSKGGKELPGRDTDKFQIKRDGDASVLYIRECAPEDAGTYICTAKNKAGEAFVAAALEVVDKIGKRQKAEAPTFLKKLGDCEVYQGMTARFTACVSGFPEPEVEWYRDNTRIFASDRVKFEREGSGLLRLVIEKVGEADVAKYKLRVVNEHGDAECDADLSYDSLEERPRRTMSDQYQDYDSLRKSGIPMPLADRPIVSRMTDRHLTLSWKPSIPKGPREPVTYRVEMCEMPQGEWFTIRKEIRSCACDIRNLEPFRDYKFRVRVENKYGISDPSPYAITYREKLEPDPPKFFPYIEPDIDFRPETSPFFPRDFDIEKPPHDGFAQAPKFLRQEMDYQYGVKGHNCQLTWFVYGYPKPRMTFYFGDELIEMGGRYDCSYTRNGQATLFINKMLERDVGIYEACAINEHGEARQRVHLQVGEYPRFTKRPEETVILARKSGSLEAKLSGVPFPDLKWYKDWLPIAPSSRIKMHFHAPDTAVLMISDAMARDEGLYSLSARNAAGAVSCSVSVKIEESESAFNYATYSGRSALRELKPNKNRFLEEFYDIGEELGRGTQGVAYHAVERLTGRNYAAKVMHGKNELKPFMLNELDIYNQLSHRKLLRLQDVFETKRSLTLITELASGGELLDVLTREEHITESLIAGYIRQILHGLDHMHSQNIAHLGLTPGDLLISHPGGDDLKICDFGLSRKIFWGKLASLNYGMPEFVAPEVANGDGVQLAADMWSLGIITLLFLTGTSPFRGANDRETLSRVRTGQWSETTIFSQTSLSEECRDFIKSLLTFQVSSRMDVKTALKHSWLNCADKMPATETKISTESLRQYHKGLKDWYSNASCRTWYRRKPLDNADIHPSCMIYPPGVTYTPPATPERTPEPRSWENKIPSRDGVDYEVGTYKSESHYQYGPDTYLLQLRDVDFPVRLREYMKVAAVRSPAFALNDARDWRAPVIRERRRFTDVMDEEIDDERKDRIQKYGSADTYTLRRLRRELGTRLDGQVEAEAIVESKRDGNPPFLREKPQLLPIVEDQNAKLTCLAVGEPKPIVQWFKNDNMVVEGKRVKISEDADGRSVLSFEPAMSNDAGIYKVVARNRVGQTVARARVVLASPPSAPDSPEAVEISDTEVLLRWKQPKDDGNSTVLCYSLQYKEADKVDWNDCANNIDHEFYLVRNLTPNVDHQFRLSACNRIGWSDKGIPTNLVKTKEAGAGKVTGMTRAMLHLQQLTESGQPVQGMNNEAEVLASTDYHIERTPLTWKDENPTEKFNFISEIARGRFSLVAKAIEKSSDRVVMAKVLSWGSETETDVLREFEAWHSLRHERICALVEAYKFSGSATFILEKLQGADVLTYLASRHEYTEQMVSFIITQVLDGLQYLHWRGICHLAIEPDNVVMAGVRSAQVKLVDFGSAQRVSKLGTLVPRSLATEFSAPEILSAEPAFPQSDVWSVGTLTYLLLSGISPYRADTVDETRQNVTFVRYRFEHLYKELTAEATRFIMLLFKRTPCKRPTAEECHEHRWLLPTEHLIKKRERAVFLGNRLKEFSETYHREKERAASLAEETRPAAIPAAAKLARSISVQEELLTPC